MTCILLLLLGWAALIAAAIVFAHRYERAVHAAGGWHPFVHGGASDAGEA